MAEKVASGGRRKTVILAVVAILVIGGGAVAAVVLLNQRKQATSATTTNGVNKESIALDDRSDTVKVAAATASTQALDGNNDGAVSTLTTAIGQTSNTDEKVSLYLQIASVYANAGKGDLAIQAEQSAMKLKPNDWQLYKNQGAIYEQLGDVTNAKASYQQADDLLKKTSDYSTYHNELQGLINNVGAAQ